MPQGLEEGESAPQTNANTHTARLKGTLAKIFLLLSFSFFLREMKNNLVLQRRYIPLDGLFFTIADAPASPEESKLSD